LLGKRVAVYYRAGDIYLPTTAKLVADTGKSIFLQESVTHEGRVRTFRWEIPYPSIIQIAVCGEALLPEKPPARLPGGQAPATDGPRSAARLGFLAPKRLLEGT